MKFRTEIETPKRPEITIEHGQTIVMLGSCFTENIGGRLERDGFDVTYNPFGPLYNPASIYNTLELALMAAEQRPTNPTDEAQRPTLLMVEDENKTTHCLNFASKYSDPDQEKLIKRIDEELYTLGEKLGKAKTVIITLGTAFVFRLQTNAIDGWCQYDGEIVGNCHKFPANTFSRERLCVEAIKEYLADIRRLLNPDTELIFTVSPIRHTADTLHGNQLSKASLLMAVESACQLPHTHYFPAYEIMLDDLRDYRFYAADMKHPSEVAVDYIYEIFSQYYFTEKTKEKALTARKESARKAHRPIL